MAIPLVDLLGGETQRSPRLGEGVAAHISRSMDGSHLTISMPLSALYLDVSRSSAPIRLRWSWKSACRGPFGLLSNCRVCPMVGCVPDLMAVRGAE